MGRILIEGLWPVTPFLDPKAYTAFTLQLATSATTNNNHSVINGEFHLKKIYFNCIPKLILELNLTLNSNFLIIL